MSQSAHTPALMTAFHKEAYDYRSSVTWVAQPRSCQPLRFNSLLAQPCEHTLPPECTWSKTRHIKDEKPEPDPL